MIWKKPSEELSQFLEEKIASFNVKKKKKMFGCPVYFVNDNMLAGVSRMKYSSACRNRIE